MSNIMRKLVFVYNANSGALNTSLDIAHKLISPSTYNCQLCNLTHGTFRERQAWKQFRETSSDELVFYHKDQFEREFSRSYSYPVVLERDGDSLEILLESSQLAKFNSAEGLIKALQDKS